MMDELSAARAANTGVTPVEIGGMVFSPSIALIGTALAKAQGMVEAARKDRTGQVGQQKTRYADLASVWDACRTALSENGLSVTQVPTSSTGDAVSIHTMLIHKSGEWVAGTLTMRPLSATPQAIGSCITYARRYALAAMVGVAPDDDDGAAASTRSFGSPSTPAAVNVDAVFALGLLAQQLGLSWDTFFDTVEQSYGTRDLGALRPDQISELGQRLRAALNAQQTQTQNQKEA
jgi:hypothetical protein